MNTQTLPAAARTYAGEAWVKLQGQAGESSLMCSWEWTAAWLEHYGDVVPHRFVLAEHAGEPAGIVLVAEQACLGRLRPPTIALGTAGEPPGSSVFVERNRLVTRPQDRARFARAVMAELSRDSHWQRLRLDGMLPADADALVGACEGARRGLGWRVEESPVADLTSADGADPLGGLPRRTRQRVQRTLDSVGPVRCEWADDVACARSILDELIALHQARWRAAGQAGAFSSPRFAAFHRDLVATLVPSGGAALFRIRSDKQTIACLYGLAEGDRLLFYQAGMLRHPDNRVAIGLAAHALFMDACRQHHFAKYDLLAPAARYKRELSNHSEQLVWAELHRPGLRLALERAAQQARRRLRPAAAPAGAV